jgi:hypothetical protein
MQFHLETDELNLLANIVLEQDPGHQGVRGEVLECGTPLRHSRQFRCAKEAKLSEVSHIKTARITACFGSGAANYSNAACVSLTAQYAAVVPQMVVDVANVPK